jgi:hypothetical protein
MLSDKIYVGDFVYIKSCFVKNKKTCYEVLYLNEDFVLIRDEKNSVPYKKLHLSCVTKNRENVSNSENISKGDLVKCIVSNNKIQEGIVISVYKNSVLVLINAVRKRLSKNRVIVVSKG